MRNHSSWEQMDSRSLLAELTRSQKRHIRLVTAVGAALIAALLITTLIILPRAVAVLDHMEQSLQEIDTLVSHTDRMVSENTDAVGDALSKVNGVDFEALNQAIRDLSDTVKPLANFARMFKGG